MDETMNTCKRDVMELLTVAVQFCAFVEQPAAMSRREWMDTLLKLLPLLYLKGAMLPQLDMSDEVALDDYVTEDDYNFVRGNAAALMAEHDDFLDVFVEDMKYSDTPILCTISECLADVYQDLKNFAEAYRNGLDEAQTEAVAQCRVNFEHYWGQRLLNAMRALHDVRYGSEDDEWEDERND